MGLDLEPGAHGNLALLVLSPERPSLALYPQSRPQALRSGGPVDLSSSTEALLRVPGMELRERALDRPRHTSPGLGQGRGLLCHQQLLQMQPGITSRPATPDPLSTGSQP